MSSMFKSQKVACFLNGFAGHGDDTEHKEMKFVFYVGAISQQLAHEVSPQIADRLFRKNEEDEWTPAKETTKATFAGITIPMQNITFYALPEDAGVFESGVLVENCAISNLRATRPTIEARLEFDVVVPMDSVTMRLVEKFYKAICFLTMEPVQRSLPVEISTDEPSLGLQEAADAAEADEEEVRVPVTVSEGSGQPAKRPRKTKEVAV